MIPALIVPILNRPDLLSRLFASLDVPVGMMIVIDNGRGVADDAALAAWHVRLPVNLGVAASWNLGIKLTPDAPWWAIVNNDVEFAPGDLAMLARNVEAEPASLWTLSGFAAFGLSREVIGRVGWFDESFHPAYCEDSDYRRRCDLAGVPVRELAAKLHHAASSTITDPAYASKNAWTYPQNCAYYERKWGAGPGGGTFTTPFDRGGSIADWPLDIARLAELRW